MKETDIQYIITVPAIWDIAAKQFMREAAVKAGIDGERLEMAYESEVAAIWCSWLNYGSASKEMETPSKYMVIDLGGGTADVSIIQKLPANHVKVIHKASGGAWGGIYVDQNFLVYLDNVLGKGVLEELRKCHIQDYFELIREFETKKRSNTFHTSQVCIMRLPFSLMEIARKRNAASGKSIGQSDKLRINQSDVKTLFSEPVSSLIDHIKDFRKLDTVNDINTVLLVGGCSESTYVQQRLRDELPGITLIVPEDAGLAVLKGAVLFGHNPSIVASRVMAHTYGIAVNNYFDEKKHPSELITLYKGKCFAINCFEIYVKVNEEIRVDQEVVRYFKPADRQSHIEVYRTMSDKPEYTIEPGCELLGKLEINSTDSVPLTDQRIEVHFMFGHTELLIKVKNVHTGEETTLALDCLK
ncbi:hypothetical protein DPMN_182828 [Dreissena polymorpha]|uniref:Uncharacterized protein n=2 Tax=Dreissena polymorpha TaxID=45954 RepID=A0A9D4DG81_DREPO|nr:hypothetical protein DPMN_182828 [Dreissena polymorpha]